MTSGVILQQIIDLLKREDRGLVPSEVRRIEALATAALAQYERDIENEYRAGYNAALKHCLGDSKPCKPE